MFITTSALCSNVEKYLKKRYSLILVYRIGSFRKIPFILAPTEFNNTDDIEEKNEEEEEA